MAAIGWVVKLTTKGTLLSRLFLNILYRILLVCNAKASVASIECEGKGSWVTIGIRLRPTLYLPRLGPPVHESNVFNRLQLASRILMDAEPSY